MNGSNLTLEMQRVYSTVAGRLIWDPNFLHSLQRNAKQALKETLEIADVDDPQDEILNILVEQYKLVKNDPNYGISSLIGLSTNYLNKDPLTVAMI